jgi:hypothetical protein
MEKNNKIKNLLIVSCLMDILGSNVFSFVTIDICEIIKNPHDNGEILIEYISHFISNGGITNYKFDNLIDYSSNIFLMLSLFNTLTNFDHLPINDKKLFLEIKKGIKEPFESLENNNNGKAVLVEVIEPRSQVDSKMIFNIDYDEKYTGSNNMNITSDICIRIIPVGIIYNKDIDTMIEMTIKITKLTNNNVTSILSAISTSYFVSLAMSDVSLLDWGDNLMKLIESDKVKKYINLDVNENMMQYVNFIKNWKEYLDSIIKNIFNTKMKYIF